MGELITAFGLGNTAIINNVCLLPLYPGLLAFLAGNAETQAGAQPNKARMGLLGGIVLAGVLTMMMVVALLLYVFNTVTEDVLPILLPTIYGTVIVLGVAMIFGNNPFARFQTVQMPILKNSYAAAYVYGLLLGPMTLPCVGPLVISAFALGADDAKELVDGLLYFFAFGLGFGWPLVALPMVAVQRQRSFIKWMTKNHETLTRVSGVLLIGIGLLGFVTEVIPNWQSDSKSTEVTTRWEVGVILDDHTEPVNALVFSADSQTLYSAGGTGNSGLFSSGQDFAIRVWDVAENSITQQYTDLTNRTEALAVSGDWLAAGGWDLQVSVWYQGELFSQETVGTGRVQDVAFSPDGDYLAAISEDGVLVVWSIAEQELSILHQTTIDRPSTLALSNDHLIVGALSGDVIVYDLSSGDILNTWPAHDNWINDIALSADYAQFATASADGTVGIWEVSSGEMLAEMTIPGQTEAITAVQYSADGRFISVAGGTQVVIWRVDNLNRPAITFRQHTASVLSLAFSADSAWLASSDQNGMVRLWETP